MGAETDCSTDVGGAKNDDTMDADDFAFDMGISCDICRYKYFIICIILPASL